MKLLPRSAFISRKLDEKSPFRQLLEQQDIIVSGRSFLEFSPVPFDQVPETDWIFFYSKRAVRYFFQQRSEVLTSEIRVGAIGPSTAQVVRSMGYTIDFEGTGNPQSTATAFGAIAKGARVLFPQARHSRQSVQQLLGDEVQGISMVVYDNRAAEDICRSAAAVLVFTSPLNAGIYLANYDLLPGQQVVAIGQPTAEACRHYGVKSYLPEAPNEPALAEAVLQCLIN